MKARLLKILRITIAWTLVSILQFLIGLNILLEVEYDFANRDPWIFFKASILTGVLAGVIGGSTLMLFWEKWLRTRPYGWTLRNIVLSYILIFYFISTIIGLFYHINYTEYALSDSELWRLTFINITHPSAIIPMIFWLLIVLGTMIVFLVNDKYGPGVFTKMLMGKYFNPTREQRVFMFLDLRSSTTIAEELGEEKYFQFLKEVYKSVTPAILKYEGEIYQYVGDEIVISWPFESGIKEANCVQCFFEIKRLLSLQKKHFEGAYGILPEFKAGLHYGHVMAGEIGVVKRDIAFLGDVLNTTSRIQGKCNELGVDILVSKYLIDKMATALATLHPRRLGEIDLKGKRQKVDLYTV